MTDTPDERVDLGPLDDDAAARAARLAARVADRVSAARRAQVRRHDLARDVRRRLARLAIPAALAAAASVVLVLATGPSVPRGSQPFAAVVRGTAPVAQWVAQNRRPALGELVAALGSHP